MVSHGSSSSHPFFFQAMYNAKLAPLLAAQSEMSEMLRLEGEGFEGEETPDGEVLDQRSGGGGKVSAIPFSRSVSISQPFCDQWE